MLPKHLPNRQGLPRGGVTLPSNKPNLFLFAMNQYSDRDKPRVELLERDARFGRVFTVSESTDDEHNGSNHISGSFDTNRFWKVFVKDIRVRGSTIILDYFWLQSGTKEKYIQSRYGGEKWMMKDGFVQMFLEAGGEKVLLPNDSGDVVFDMINKHKDSWTFTSSLVRGEDNPLVQVSKAFPDQNKYIKDLTYFAITRREVIDLTQDDDEAEVKEGVEEAVEVAVEEGVEEGVVYVPTNLPPRKSKRKRSFVNYNEQENRPVPKIITPVKVGECAFEWKELEVKPSLESDSGDGVFAKQDLPVGTMFPIVGKLHEGKMAMKVHGWQYISSGFKEPTYIDGDPSINPHKGIGNFGMSIAMMPNERTMGIHNCRFRFDYLIVAEPIKKGDELTVYYGKDYDTVRKQRGYSLENNKTLKKDDYPLDDLEEKEFPDRKKRRKVIDDLNRMIMKCGQNQIKFSG